MAKQVSQAEVLQKLKGRGLGTALDTAKDTPPNTGNARLPAGIKGIAQLRSVKIGEFEQGDHKGELFFMATGVLVEPVIHEGQTVRGMPTRIGPEPLCDTPKSSGKYKTKQDHVNRMVGWLYGLGVKTGSIINEEQLMAACLALENAKPKPHFRIETRKSSKQEIKKMADGKFYLCYMNEDGSVREKVAGKGPYQNEQMGKQLNPFAGRDPMVFEEWQGVCAPPQNQMSHEQVALNGCKSTEGAITPDSITPGRGSWTRRSGGWIRRRGYNGKPRS